MRSGLGIWALPVPELTALRAVTSVSVRFVSICRPSNLCAPEHELVHVWALGVGEGRAPVGAAGADPDSATPLHSLSTSPSPPSLSLLQSQFLK